MSKQIMAELKRCPFCGADSGSLYFVTVELETVGIFCNACKQTVTLEENDWEGDNETTRAVAIEAWNRRQPQRMRGNWVCIDGTNTECDQCGFVLEDWIQGAFYNFCPHCGADMRGEQE